MARYANTITDANGVALIGVEIYVYEGQDPDLTLATLTDDDAQPLANPVVSDDYGNFYFNADDGVYRLSYHYQGKERLIDEAVEVGVGLPLPDAVLLALSGSGGASLVGTSLGYSVQQFITNLLSSTGSTLVGFLQSGTGAQSETVQTVLRNFGKMVTSFGANPTDASDDTAAIQAAIDTGALNILFPPGTYYAHGLTMATQGQRLVALGRVCIFKNANGTLLTSSGQAQGIKDIEFQGVSATYTGDNIVSTANFFSFEAGSEDSAGYAVKCTGGAPLIMPGPWRIWTADTSGTGYDIYILGSGSANLYGRIIATYSSLATGGILLENTGAVQIQGGQFGKLTVKVGAGSSGNTGPTVVGARVVGACVVEQSGTHLDGKFASNVTIGDGTNAISGIIIPPTFSMQTPNTLTINNNVVESSFHLGQLYSGSVTVTIDAGSVTTNDIWHGAIAYTPSFASSSGSPAVGNGTIAGSYSRSGRTITASVSFTIGSTTNGGTGAIRLGLPTAIKGATGVQKIDSGLLTDVSAPLNYVCATKGAPSNGYMEMAYDNAAALVANGGPFSFATGDLIYGQLTYDC